MSSDYTQQKIIFQKQITDFLDGFSHRFTPITNYQSQKGKLGYGTKLNIPGKTSSIFFNVFVSDTFNNEPPTLYIFSSEKFIDLENILEGLKGLFLLKTYDPYRFSLKNFIENRKG